MTIRYLTNWQNLKINQIIDVRSPDEYAEDHIPNAINIPVLNNTERALIGTIYKKESPFKAKKLGASIVSKNISNYIKNKLINTPGNWKPLIYCWRGGQRSKSLALTLSEIGWEISILKGGYKSYRKHVNIYLNKIISSYNFLVISGPTGSAKTKVLDKLELLNCPVLNLEYLANHKGSLLGKNPGANQPSQKYFESLLYSKFKKFNRKVPILIESESSKIGNLYLPSTIISKIEKSPSIEINTDIKSRVSYLIKDYKSFIKTKDSFNKLFAYANVKLGKDIVTAWKVNYNSKDWKKLAYQLIVEYYDPLYNHKKNNRINSIIDKYNLSNLENNTLNKFCKLIKNKYFSKNK